MYGGTLLVIKVAWQILEWITTKSVVAWLQTLLTLVRG